jgi:hypothetical protein
MIGLIIAKVKKHAGSDENNVTPFLPSLGIANELSFVIGRTVSLTNMHIGVVFEAKGMLIWSKNFSLTVLYMTSGRQGRRPGSERSERQLDLGCLRSRTRNMPPIEIGDCKP